MKEITVKVYTFDELDDKAKEKARDWYRDGALYYDWWAHVYKDAENVMLKITEFDLGRGSYVKAKFLSSAEETAHLIEKEHGKECATFKTAMLYLKERDELITKWPKDADGEFENVGGLDDDLDTLDRDFLYSLQEDYRGILNNEMEYLLSDECIDESIRANEYAFTADGKRSMYD